MDNTAPCGAIYRGFECTRDIGHEGDHEGRNGDYPGSLFWGDRVGAPPKAPPQDERITPLTPQQQIDVLADTLREIRDLGCRCIAGDCACCIADRGLKRHEEPGSDRTYTIKWRRADEPTKHLRCTHLTERDIVRRIIGAIHNSGPVIIDSLERERK